MPDRWTRVLIAGVLFVAACAMQRTDGSPPSQPEGLVLAIDEGERRVRTTPNLAGALLILKVDERNGDSREMTMAYEEIPAGQSIRPHHHPHADEIIFVHRGSGIGVLGEWEVPIRDGATIYIPRNTRVALRNTGPGPLAIVFFFSRPGFEAYLRETSAMEEIGRASCRER